MKELQSLDDIFSKRLLRIPDYQRGYAWGRKQLVEFWEDLISLDSNRSHYTGVISIKAVPPEDYKLWSDASWLLEKRGFSAFYIVDGQQRITTISIFIQCLIENIIKSQVDKTLTIEKIRLGSYPLSEIIEKYIVISEPIHNVIKTYKFGYEVDNPSFEFMRHHIFNEPYAATSPSDPWRAVSISLSGPLPVVPAHLSKLST